MSLAVLGLLLLLPNLVAAQQEYASSDPPSIGQPLLREGDLAVQLVQALSLGAAQDELEAENQLAAAGISPQNGWIADYPVTPDIIDELRQSVRVAASSGTVPMSAEAAIERLNQVLAQAGLSVQPQSSAKTETSYTVDSAQSPSYQDPTVINNYYVTEGPPAVTYYAPPPAYSYLYGWVPYPFWSAGFWFPGFFILHDFHRTVFIGDRVVFVSNHFRDFRHHKIIRLDPVARIRGHNSARIHTRDFRGIRDFRDTRGVADFRDARNGRDLRGRDGRAVIAERGATRGRTVVGEPRSQAALNAGRMARSGGRGAVLNSTRGSGTLSGRDPAFMTPSGVVTRPRATAVNRSPGVVTRGAGDFGSGANLRGAGFTRRAVFDGMASGGSRGSSIGQFRNVRTSRDFGVSRGSAASIPSFSTGRGSGSSFSGGSFRGSPTISSPRGGSAGGSSFRGGSFNSMGTGGRSRR